MRQRVAIAIALLNNPDLIIADEPTTALDVTIQGQILFEMQKLTRETGAALIWITHDLSVVAGLADRVCVMYAGRIVEQGSVRRRARRSRAHPYTQGLLDSVPSRSARGARLRQIPGMTPSLLDLPPGCAFRERCARADRRLRGDRRRCAPAGAAARRSACAATIRWARASARDATVAPTAPEPAPAAAPLVELRGVSKRFVKSLDVAARIGNLLGAGRARGGRARGRRRRSRDRAGRGRRPRRRIRLRQVDARPARGRAAAADRGRALLARRAARRTRRPTRRAAQQLKMQMIFQDPYASLNPRMRVVDIVGEAPVAHGLIAPRAADRVRRRCS